MRVSFDFDGTLEFESVQEYAKELIAREIDVWIVTSRFESAEKYNEFFGTTYKVDIVNKHLYEVALDLHIPSSNIFFTNMLLKYNFFKNNEDFAWHLDDNFEETKEINRKTKVRGIDIFANRDWKSDCEEAMINKINK